MLPKPPSPPLAKVICSPGTSNSCRTSPVSASAMMVPTGILSTMSSPLTPNMSEPLPCSPRCASKRRVKRKSTSVLRLASAMASTWPPRPPSPPSGPPNSLYFSWRKEAQPLPPSPAATSIVASSTNFIISFLEVPTQKGPQLRALFQCLADGCLRRSPQRPIGRRAASRPIIPYAGVMLTTWRFRAPFTAKLT